MESLFHRGQNRQDQSIFRFAVGRWVERVKRDFFIIIVMANIHHRMQSILLLVGLNLLSELTQSLGHLRVVLQESHLSFRSVLICEINTSISSDIPY